MSNKNNTSVVKGEEYEGNIGLVMSSIKVEDIIFNKVIYLIKSSGTYDEMTIEEFNNTFQLVLNG